jgi:hypothetical protein
MKITQETLINDKAVRENYINRVGVLDDVKDLLLLPSTEMTTLPNLAKYFEVSKDVIEAMYRYHESEFTADGVKYFKQGEVIREMKLNLGSIGLEKMRGKAIITIAGEEITIPNRGLRLFPRRAILYF